LTNRKNQISHQLFEKINWKDKSKLADERKEEDLNDDEKSQWKK
jgi:hypothetical protein